MNLISTESFWQEFALGPLLMLALLAGVPSPAPAETPNPDDITFFEEKIRPVLAEKCYKCHSDRAQKLKGDLKLDSRASILKGGNEGASITVGDSSQSFMIELMRHEVPDMEMPPKEKLPEAVVKDFERWIERGAVFPEGGNVAATEPWWEKVDTSKLPQMGKPVHEVVDKFVAEKLNEDNVKAAPATNDYEFIRRVTLDLAGRIPTAKEVDEFVNSEESKKREQLVDRLMLSDSFLRHKVIEFTWLLMDEQDGNMGNFLTKAFEEGRSWDQIFEEVILPDQTNEERQGATEFLKDRIKDQDQLTTDVSVKFFGVNVSCAQCHDHPEVPSWKQDHYYGMKSFFSRTFDVNGFIGEKDYGQVSFKTTAGETKQAELMFLTARKIDEPESKEPDKEAKEEEKKLLEKLKKEKKPPPAPKFSRRAKLIEAGLRDGDNMFFARSIVNRMWDQMFGRGLVVPLDQMHGANTPSHPELLEWLAKDLIESGYDLNRLYRGLALSEAYARSSRWDDSQRPSPTYFAVALPRPLTPHQMGASLVIASQDPESVRNWKEEDQESRIEQLEKSGHGWANNFERPGELFQIGVGEALFISNNDRVQRDLLGEGGKLVGALLKIEGARERIDTAWLSVLSRKPIDEEIEAVNEYLSKREDREKEAWKQIVWSLMAGTEMRFNH